MNSAHVTVSSKGPGYALPICGSLCPLYHKWPLLRLAPVVGVGTIMESSVIQEASFHDNKIHSIKFVDEDFETDLILDIDHILEWIQSGETFQFKIVPAKLKFKNVSDLEIRLNKPGFTINSYLETILEVDAEDISDDRIKYTVSLLNSNYIKFAASSYALERSGDPTLKTEQYLTLGERENA